jgi:predicted small secreted protein
MKLNRFIVPLVAVLFLASCNSASGGGKKEKTTSAEPTSKTYQPIPSYPNLPDYGEYEGTPGVGEDEYSHPEGHNKGKGGEYHPGNKLCIPC